MLTESDKNDALAHLNEICADTFNEGEFGPWKFKKLSLKGKEWTLTFTNYEGGDAVSFEFDGECIDDDGQVDSDWFDAVNTAIIEWEAEMSD